MRFFILSALAGFAAAQTTFTQTQTIGTDVVTTVTPVTTVLSTATVSATNTVNVDTTVAGGTVQVTVSEITTVLSGDMTVTAPTETVTAGGSTVFVTASGTVTVTETVFSGFTTVNSCIPTTTIITTVTETIPVPTSPPGQVVTFKSQKCSVVVCPYNSNVINIDGMPKKCTLTFYGDVLTSSTCIPEFCCASVDYQHKIVHTTCKAYGLQCPANCYMLHSSDGASVPCLLSYQKNVLVASTCDQSTCCSAPVQSTVTITVGNVVTTSEVFATETLTGGKNVSCKTAVKCAVYMKDPKTNYIPRCNLNECSTVGCCRTI